MKSKTTRIIVMTMLAVVALSGNAGTFADASAVRAGTEGHPQGECIVCGISCACPGLFCRGDIGLHLTPPTNH